MKTNTIVENFRSKLNVLGPLLLILILLLFGGRTARAQAYNWNPVVINGGGFVTGIDFHPKAPGLMYCRTDIGGAYRWNPTNDSWIQLLNFVGYPNNEESLSGCESIGLDPEDTNRLYLACGWEGGSNPSAIMISTNQGESFTTEDSPWVMESNGDGRGSGERFGVDPNFGSTVFYGTHLAGLWKSTNYAQNWSQVTSFPVTAGTTNGVGIIFVQFIASSGTSGSPTPVIWVGVSQGAPNLYRSTDGGATWASVTTGAPANYMPHHAAQDGLGNMYITFCDAPGPNSVSYGVVRKFNLSTLTSIAVTPPTGEGGFGGVTVDAENPETVAVSTIDCWYPQNYIYRSSNGGTNWTQTYGGTVNVSSGPWMGLGGNDPLVQGWSDDVEIDPYNSNDLFFISGGGVFSSFNFTAAQPSWEFQSTGIEEMVYCQTGYALAVPPSGAGLPQLWSAFGDDAGFAHFNLTVSPPVSNCFPGGGNNYSIDFAEQNPNLVVRTYYNNSGRSGYFSTDAGSSWSTFASEPEAAATNGPGEVVISADGSRMLWAIPGFPPYYSTNDGSTWTESAGSNLTPEYVWEQPYPYSDRVNSNIFYLYMPDTGVVHVSTNGGASFYAGATITGWADSMHATFGEEGNLWVAISSGLWRTTNAGASFFKVPGVQAAHAVGFGMAKTNGDYPSIYMHGEISNTWGVYRSDNQGTNWTRINDNQHQYGGIQQVTGDPKIYGRCYIGALGIVYGDLPDQPPFTPSNLTATGSNAAVYLGWWTAAGADSYIIERSTTNGGPYSTIATDAPGTNYVDSEVENGTTYYYVMASTNSYGLSSYSAQASATPNLLVPLPWETEDIGAVGVTGNAGFTNGVFTLLGAGADIQNTADAFRFVYVTTTGNCTISAQVTSVEDVNVWSKAGVMIRQGLDAGAANAFVGVTPGNGVTWQYRTNAGANTGWNNTGSLTAPYWVKLVCSGSAFTGYRSPDGTNWTEQGSATITMTSNVYVGLALTSHNSSSLCAGSFANVVAPGWTTSFPPAAPTGLAATAGDAQVALSWNASLGATNYYVERSTTSGSGYVSVATNASLSFTDTGLNDGTLYHYVVGGGNVVGQGANSAEVSARPTSFAPTQLGFAMAGNQVQLNWPSNHTGWQLQAQTNSLGTNWVNVSGSAQTNELMLLLNPTNQAVYFRLVGP